ncbi:MULTISPECIES: Bax inhibitor-1/YccA family protein [Terrabacteria group]|uniref:Bax inhibitor-1/YccA family protein n=1 Tax=Bacillati TaxID=1783272 RepID=UPI001C6E7EAA|nr:MULTISPECIES: Bax inhibitor-1/YccA family protein [Terrabacteria group]MBW9212562.1 Bax inhibitor-1/YccA family protein [Trueperella sp. zg.1013]
MSEFRDDMYTSSRADSVVKSYMTKVYGFMAIALLLTAGVAYMGYQSLLNGGLVFELLKSGNGFGMWAIFLVQLGLAFGLSAGISRFPAWVNGLMMIVYSFVTGITFSVLPIIFEISTIYQAFIYASILFVSLAMVGTFTSVNLSKFSGILFSGLVALVLINLLAFFIPSLYDHAWISYLGLVIFMGLTAWDAQKLKEYALVEGGENMQMNLAIYGAFELYLDFVNMFIYLLRILGGGRSKR